MTEKTCCHPLQPVWRESHQPHFLVHPSVTATVNQSRKEEKLSDCMNISQTFKVTKKKKKSDPSSRRLGRESSSSHYPTNKQSLTVSAIRSSFFITGVPDWHKIDFSVTSKKSTLGTNTCPHIIIVQYKYSCRYKHTSDRLSAAWCKLTEANWVKN